MQDKSAARRGAARRAPDRWRWRRQVAAATWWRRRRAERVNPPLAATQPTLVRPRRPLTASGPPSSRPDLPTGGGHSPRRPKPRVDWPGHSRGARGYSPRPVSGCRSEGRRGPGESPLVARAARPSSSPAPRQINPSHQVPAESRPRQPRPSHACRCCRRPRHASRRRGAPPLAVPWSQRCSPHAPSAPLVNACRAPGAPGHASPVAGRRPSAGVRGEQTVAAPR
ncbi:hypothetical protein E2C01_033221 [Portunus trituberculatus]|uniref:Uncharacterized protein n=1 Tax=Portunus trituberculatus TaxID=210409 RepID=A0A5B7F1V8_PORTR|nr:hypothetical protein [Portunus trituberculatus]